jgi:hypothetical protein
MVRAACVSRKDRAHAEAGTGAEDAEGSRARMQSDKESDSDAGEQEQSDTYTVSRAGSIRVSGTDQGSAEYESARSLGVKWGGGRALGAGGVVQRLAPLYSERPCPGGRAGSLQGRAATLGCSESATTVQSALAFPAPRKQLLP